MKKILSIFTMLASLLMLVSCLQTDVIVKEKSLASLYEEVHESVVTIESYSMDQMIGSGSGMVFDKVQENGDTNYYVLTNHHVVEGASHTRIYFTQTSYEIGDIYITSNVDENGNFSSSEDVAILRFTSNKNYRVQTIEPYHNNRNVSIRVGEKVFAIGSPLGIEFHRLLSNEGTIGMVDNTWIVHGVNINPGNSGGPLYSSIDGMFVGMNTQRVEKTSNGERDVVLVGMSLHVNQVSKILKSLIQQANDNPKLGITIMNSHGTGEGDNFKKGFFDLTTDNFDPNDYVDTSKQGVVVIDVSLTRASFGKLEQYDLITHVNGKQITNLETLTAEIGKIAFNNSYTFTIVRKQNDSFVTIDVVVKVDKI